MGWRERTQRWLESESVRELLETARQASREAAEELRNLPALWDGLRHAEDDTRDLKDALDVIRRERDQDPS